jgi:hypothetical protein
MIENIPLSLDRAKEALSTITIVKRDVHENSFVAYNSLKGLAESVSQNLDNFISEKDSRIHVEFKDVSKNEFWLQFGGDLLIFSLHSNVFSFDSSHSLFNTNYVQENHGRAYFCMIEVFNFLNDSVKFNRYRDVGELVGRVFINSENHFFVEGMGAVGSLYSDLTTQIFDSKMMNQILETFIVSSIQFDLWAPPFQNVRFMPLANIIEQNGNSPRSTSKRMGYQVASLSEPEIE